MTGTEREQHTDDEQTEQTATDSAAESPSAAISYRCPFCEATYPTEMLTRVHISRATDELHAGHDGMTPEVEPIECDGSGREIGRVFTLPGQLNLHALELDDIPGRYAGRAFDERERRALLVAAFNANREMPVPELQDRVTAHLEQQGFDPLSLRDLRELCDHVFQPHVDPDDSGDDGTDIRTAETTLRDLTALQQAIILAHLAHPETDWETIATEVGTAASYPAQVITARTALIRRLEARIDGEAGIERLIAERVPAEDLSEIREAGYLDAFEIDLAAAQSRKGDRRHTDRDVGTRELPGTTAEPESPVESSASGEPPQTGVAPQVDGDWVRQADVEAILTRIDADLERLGREMELAEPTPQQARIRAHLERIRNDLATLL